MARVADKMFGIYKVKELNRGIRIVLDTTGIGLRFSALKKSELHIRAHSNASYGTNDDLSSQLRCIIMFCDNSNRFHILGYSRYNSKRAIRSVMGGEVYALMNYFGMKFVAKKDLEEMLYYYLEYHHVLGFQAGIRLGHLW